MPGLCGFLAQGPEDSSQRLQPVLEALVHHPSHQILAAFSDGKIVAGQVLWQTGRGGIHWQGPRGTQIWIDGEAFNETGPIPLEELVMELSQGVLKPLNGSFSAVVYLPEAEEIRFITDPYGLKYLYVRTEGAPAWCSEQKSFCELPGPPLRFNPDCLRENLDYGHPLGNKTWFLGIELLDPGLILTYDLKSGRWNRQRYFQLARQEPQSPVPTWDSAVRKLGGLFRKAVTRRSSDDPRIGLTLSGGLDSRAILAALPPEIATPETVTFGQAGCADALLAKTVCAVRGAHNTFVPLGGTGWLEKREKDVRLTDGQINILHLHGLESLPAIEGLMDVDLNGFLGDALLGGSYLEGEGFPFLERYLNRGRRFILQALHYGGTRVIYRLPFLDLSLLKYTLSLPRSWLSRSRIYRAMLLQEFPEYYRSIAWEKTGLPISTSWGRERLAAWVRRIHRLLGRRRTGYTDYATWLREGSAAEFLRSYLESPDTILYDFVAKDIVEERLRSHFQGIDESEMLGRYLTAEIWLRFLRVKKIV